MKNHYSGIRSTFRSWSPLFRTIFWGVMMLFLHQSTFAQRGCGTDDILRQERAKDPLFDHKINHQNEVHKRQQLVKSKDSRGMRLDAVTYTLPVVVHVIAPLNGDVNYISDQQIKNGITHLNQAFSNSAPYNVATGTNTNIQFCLAQQNAWGAYTSGITRITHQFAVLDKDVKSQEQAIKDAIVTANSTSGKGYNFDPRYYINIYLVPDIKGDVAGYAYLPYSGNHGVLYSDGIINEAKYFGANVDDSKIHIHEMGHYLGLFHTFEGYCPSGNCPNDANTVCPANNNCEQDGDKICDTPPDRSTAAVACGSSVNSCSTDVDDLDPRNPFRPTANGGIGDQPDKIVNHMDYGYHSCHNSFTPKQGEKMVQQVTSTRSLLIAPEAKGCLSPCANPLNVAFTVSATTVNMPTAITFTNTTTGTETGYNWAWSFGDATTSTVKTPPAKAYGNPGTYTIKLTAQNSDVSCKREFEQTVTVICPAITGFTVNGASTPIVKMNPGETATFTSTVTGSSIEWIQDGVVIGTGNTFSKSYTSGGYSIQQRVGNGTCKSTSKNIFLDVNRCGGSSGKERNIWVFGTNGRIDFTTGSPVSTNQPFSSFEGTTVMTSSDGQLLFYADAARVYDRQGNVLANGLGGGSSTSQVVSFKKPGSNNLYYIFVPADNGFITYSIVDMSLGNLGTNNKPLGSVTTLSQPLTERSTERVCALKSKDGLTVHVITQNPVTLNWVNHKVTATGISAPALTAKTGSQSNYAIGNLKFSHDGSKLAVCYDGGQAVEVFSFNAVTGQIGALLFSDYTLDINYTYGLEFSPDGSKLYTTPETGSSRMYQYDLNNNFSRTLISFPANTNLGYQMLLGPDGRIYFLTYPDNRIHAINSPNAAGLLCDVQYNVVTLANGSTNGLGLPNFMVDLSSNQFLPKIDGPDCVIPNATNIAFQSGIVAQAGETIKWSVIGGNPIQAEIVGANNGSNVTLKFYGVGTVKLRFDFISPCGNQFVEKSISIGGAACSDGCPMFAMRVDAPRDLNIIGKEVFDIELNSMNGKPINNFNFTFPTATGRPFVVESTPMPKTITFAADPNNTGKYLPVKLRVMGRYVTNTYGQFKQDMRVATNDGCIDTPLPLPDPDMNIFLYGYSSWQAPGMLDCAVYKTGKVFTSTLGFSKAASDVTKIDFQLQVDPSFLEPETPAALASSFVSYPGYTLSNLSYNSTTGTIGGTLTFAVKSDLIASDSDGDPVYTNSNLLGLKLKIKGYPSGGCRSYIRSTSTVLTLKSFTGTFTVPISNYSNSIVYQDNSTTTGCGCVWPKYEICTSNCSVPGVPDPKETRITYDWVVNGKNSVTPGSVGSPKVVADPLTGLSFLVFGAPDNSTVTTVVNGGGNGGPGGGDPPPGSSGKALKFDASNDYVEVPNYPEINLGLGNFTFEALINADPIQVSYPQILSKRSSTSYNGFLFGLWTSGKPFIQMGPNMGNYVCNNCPSLKDSTCHFVAVSRNGESVSFYVDGTLRQTLTVPVAGRDMSSAFPLRIGDDAQSPSNTRFKGTIEQVRIWNLARTTADIAASYNKQLRGIESGLVAYFKMDEGAGQAIYNRVPQYQYHGRLGSTTAGDAMDPTWQAGSCMKFTLQFSGNSPYQYVEVPSYPAINLGLSSFTLEAWIKTASPQIVSYPQILSKRGTDQDGFLLGLFDDGKPFVQINGWNFHSSITPDLRDNACHQISVTKQLNQIKFYIDGVLRETVSGVPSSLSASSTANLRIGHDIPNIGNTSFKGTIDEVRIWNLARTATDIANTGKVRITGAEQGLVGYWRINEGQGQVVKNFSTNKIDGVLGANSGLDNADPTWVFQAGCVNRKQMREEAVETSSTSQNTEVTGELVAYPNPFSDQLQFILRGVDAERVYDAKLYNAQGFLIKTETSLAAETIYNWSMPQGLPSGTYLLKLSDAEGRQWNVTVIGSRK